MDTLLFLLAFYLPVVGGLKILVYQTAAAPSHMPFSGALIDLLAEAGHEVHLVTAEWNPAAKSDGTTHAASSRRIRPSSNISAFTQMDHLKDPFNVGPWSFYLSNNQLKLLQEMVDEFCQVLVNDKELLQWIRKQKFDIALTSVYGNCQYGLFYKAGIKPVLGYVASPATNYILNVLGIDTPSSYTSEMSRAFRHGDDMTYFERALNFITQNLVYHYVTPLLDNRQQQWWTEKYGPSFPSLRELMSKTTYVFVNTNELIDFPRPLTHKIVFVGGIGVRKPKKVDKYYNKLLSLRKGTILFSFGSSARTTLMPRQMIIAFLEAFAKFPDYTFIWKTDAKTMKDNLFTHYPNVQLVDWMAQNDLLNDGRISVFITHAGLNSLEEAVHAGVPMITVPLFFDQMHNAAVAEKRGVAYSLDKWNITKEAVVTALETVLYDKRYMTQARILKEMLKKKPEHDVRKRFIEYVEFAAEYKSVGESLQLHSVHFGIVQLYCMDIIVPGIFIIIALFYALFRFLAIVFRKIKRTITAEKSKTE